MQTQRRAVIDVGTNSVKLLVADVQGSLVQPVLEQSDQTRLGRGFYPAHRLQPEAITATARAVAHFADAAKEANAAATRVIATSAARDALNQQELRDAIRAACGLAVEIIDGNQEADLVFRGVSTDRQLAEERLLIVDVGGGSSEFILGECGEKAFAVSVSIGSVRLLEMFPASDPPSEQEFTNSCAWIHQFVEQQVRPSFAPLLGQHAGHPPQLVGVGGTASILARIEHVLGDFDRERIETTRLSLDRMSGLTQRLWSLPLAERKKIVGLPPNRADVILMGAAIFLVVMEAFHFPEMRISTRGLRFAAVTE